MERKAMNFELKDLDKGKREAVIAHATYDDIDRVDDVARKGMFTKSWNEMGGDVMFYFNHDETKAPGKVTGLSEDTKHAYTKVWLGTHTLGNDVLTMMDEGIIKKASFGFATVKSNPLNMNGRKVRELKEVAHFETSVLTKLPAHPKSGVVSVKKSFEFKSLSTIEQDVLKKLMASDQVCIEDLIALSDKLSPDSDLYTWVLWNISRRADMMSDLRSQIKYNTKELNDMKLHVKNMEKFCRNTTASDETIKMILKDIDEANLIITQAEGVSLEPVSDIADAIKQFRLTI